MLVTLVINRDLVETFSNIDDAVTWLVRLRRMHNIEENVVTVIFTHCDSEERISDIASTIHKCGIEPKGIVKNCISFRVKIYPPENAEKLLKCLKEIIKVDILKR